MSNNPISDLYGESVELDNPFTHLDSEPEEDTSDLFNAIDSLEIDPEELGRKEAELFLESGWYKWKDKNCTITESFQDNDKNENDVAQLAFKKTNNLQLNRGRAIYSVTGTAVEVTKGKRGRYFFQYSPDDRYKENKKTGEKELDIPSKNYRIFTSFYFRKKEEKVRNQKVLKDFIKSSNYQMRITQGNEGGIFFNGVKDL